MESDLGKRLRVLVNQTGLTIVDFADACGLKPDTVSAYIRGKNEPSIARLRVIRRVLSGILGRKVEWKELLG